MTRLCNRLPATLSRLTAVSLVVGVMLTLPVLTLPGSAQQPVPTRLTSISVSGVDQAALRTAPEVPAAEETAALSRATRPVAMSREVETKRPFRVVGVSWSGQAGSDLTLWVRTRAQGVWSGWQEVHADASHAPDPGTAEASRERGGSEPLIVESSDAVQLRADGATPAPAGLALDVVDPGTTTADGVVGTTPAGSAQAAGTRPAVYTRAQWGADESLRKAAPSYGTVRVGFVHHTAGSNSYTQADVPAIIRGIYAFHVNGRGWNDIGYSFLVDKWGRMWEGRYGGMDKAVIGAHTGGYNSQSFAMSALGTYTSTQPSSATLTAYNKLFAWKLSLAHVNPLATTVMTDADGSPTRTYRNISGHRDFNDGSNNTACPGTALYNKIEGMRSAVKSLQGTEFYAPRLSATAWNYGAGGVTVQGTTSRTLTFTVKVVSTCQPGTVVATQTGTSTASAIAAWNGKLANGSWAPPGGYRLTVTGSTGSGTALNAVPWTTTVDVRRTTGSPIGWCPERIGGTDRYAVSVAAARSANPSARTVVLANGSANAMGDALVSGPLAKARSAALLLTQAGGLPSSVAADITARKVTTAFLVGGTGSISTAVETQLRGLGVTTITRYAGANRFEVAANVARAIGSSAPDVMVASGRPAAIADGLVVSGPAAALKRPILLVLDSGVPDETREALSDLGAQRSVVAGGLATVPDSVLAQLPSPTRLGGASRYEVSANVATWSRGKLPVSTVLISSGLADSLADTLSGGQFGRPTLYVNRTGVPGPVATWLDRSPDLAKVTVMGGTGSVPDAVAGRAQQSVAQ